MRPALLICVLLLVGCGSAAATIPKPSPSPTPTTDVSGMYVNAIQKAHDHLVTDYAAISAAANGSAAEMTAARHLALDFQNLLETLDGIPFPPNAQTDLSALKQALVALQIFWSGVANNTASFNSLTGNSLATAYSQAALVLGHDVGVTLVISAASPTP